MTAEIIRGKEMPALRRRGVKPKYPWLQLQPGESFRFETGVTLSGARSMASSQIGGATGTWKFSVRECEDGIYCWRTDGTAMELENGNYAEDVAIIPARQQPANML